MIHPNWDLNISLNQFRKVLKNPKDKRFSLFFTRVLSRVPFREVFHYFITPKQFKKYYLKLRKQINADFAGAGKIEFWDFLYKKVK